MSKYLYGIINWGKKIDISEKGIGGESVCNIPYQGIGAIVSELSPSQFKISKENVFIHEGVVEKLMEDFAVLPMRFGAILEEEKQIKMILKRYHQEFQDNLVKVENKVELGVRILWDSERIKNKIIDANEKIKNITLRVNKKSPGERYLLEKMGGELIERILNERADTLIARIHKRLERYADDSRLKRLATPKMVLSASYLVPREKIDQFKTEFQEIRKKYKKLAFLYSGAWPPYSFIETQIQIADDGKMK